MDKEVVKPVRSLEYRISIMQFVIDKGEDDAADPMLRPAVFNDLRIRLFELVQAIKDRGIAIQDRRFDDGHPVKADRAAIISRCSFTANELRKLDSRRRSRFIDSMLRLAKGISKALLGPRQAG